jgi:parallel beta-helix repeat protein
LTEHYGADGITWLNKAGKGCRATNNVVYNNIHCGMKGGMEILIEGNVIFGNGTGSLDHGVYAPYNDTTINGNLIFENAGWGVHVYPAPKHLAVTRNVCFGNKVGGIILGGGECKVFNNVCSDNGIGIFYFRSGCISNVVENNVSCFNHTDCGLDKGGGDSKPSNNTDDFNCYFPGKPNAEVKPEPNEVTADPLFVDAKKRDYRLREKSPCVGAGTDVGLPYEGKKPNLGAY